MAVVLSSKARRVFFGNTSRTNLIRSQIDSLPALISGVEKGDHRIPMILLK